MLNNLTPEDWIRKTYARLDVDLNVVLRMKCIGTDYAVGQIKSAADNTGDLTFEQGATTGAAAGTTGDNPGSSGVINISGLSTIYDLWYEVNLADDWEAWFVDFVPDGDIEVTAANCIYLDDLSDEDAKVANGVALYGDLSLETAEIFPVGVSLQGPSSIPHSNDHQVLHEVLQVVADVTFGGASAGIKVYECDDSAGSSVLIDTMALVSGAATTFNMAGEPLYATKGKRLVFQATDASAAITTPSLSVAARSFKFGPAANKKKMWCTY